MTVSSIDLEGVTLEYRLSGESAKSVVMFVHGLAADLRQFREQHPLLQEEYRVLSVSLRGHGGSGCPDPAGRDEFTLESMAGDIACLLDRLEIPAVHWVGNSMGGLVGYQLLKDQPERIASLATFGTAAELQFGKAAISMITFFKDVLITVAGYKGLCTVAGRAGSKNPEVQKQIIEMMLSASPKAMKYAQMNIGRYSYLETINTAKIPLLLIRGEHDRQINRMLSSTLDSFESAHNARVVDVPDAGHYINLDQPEAFNSVLREWLLCVGSADG